MGYLRQPRSRGHLATPRRLSPAPSGFATAAIGVLLPRLRAQAYTREHGEDAQAASQASAATTSAWVPVSRVGWMTGAKLAEWLTGMSWEIRPAFSAAS